MVRNIDIASFTCTNCLHRSTPPDTINRIAHEMERYEVIQPDIIEDEVTKKQTRVPAVKEEDKAQYKNDIETFHAGNKVKFVIVGNNTTIVKMERSYTKAQGDKTELAESDHIILKCPECDAVLYEVDWRRVR